MFRIRYAIHGSELVRVTVATGVDLPAVRKHFERCFPQRIGLVYEEISFAEAAKTLNHSPTAPARAEGGAS